MQGEDSCWERSDAAACYLRRCGSESAGLGRGQLFIAPSPSAQSKTGGWRWRAMYSLYSYINHLSCVLNPWSGLMCTVHSNMTLGTHRKQMHGDISSVKVLKIPGNLASFVNITIIDNTERWFLKCGFRISGLHCSNFHLLLVCGSYCLHFCLQYVKSILYRLRKTKMDVICEWKKWIRHLTKSKNILEMGGMSKLKLTVETCHDC